MTWPILVLSLPASAVRRAQIDRQLGDRGLSYEFIDAVDGRAGLPAPYECMVDRDMVIARRGYPMSDGEIACALGHHEIYRRIVEDKLDGAIVLEDDAILTDLFVPFLEQRGYLSADLIQMCYYDVMVWKGSARKLGSGINRLRLSENCYMTAAYSISRRGAAKLLAATTPITERADWPIDIARLGACITEPRLVEHPPLSLASTQSMIAPGRAGLIPEGFDFSAAYVKGWRRLITPAAWRRFFQKRLSRRILTPFPDVTTRT